ncbi:tyrosine-type recombinase/integrase [Robertmurraya andreesenii]|uniref:Integrase/recombinase XerD n=1 Tax=Anoxybacillus andreesenii TaxID=1325932 RepID=A0ABT9V203_9BACL|nr:site-specific integrase [Robertmurraya andreesenii]MDQ0154985.1 integrase/recombinase XerD [Robertmurraya andreesenii]
MRKGLQRRYARKETSEFPLTMTEMFEQYMLVKKGEGLAKRTIEEHYTNFTYLKDYLNAELSADEMTTEVFMGWITYMIEEKDYAAGTVNIRVRTVRSFLRYAYEEKGWLNEPIHRRFKPIKDSYDKVDALTTDEFRRLVGACDDSSYTGFRLKVATYVLLDTLVRVFELVNIRRRNVDFKTMRIWLEPEDTKPRVGRYVPISARTAKLLSEYMRETDDFGVDYVFLTYEGEPMSESTLRDNLRVAGQIAKIKDKRVSPHTLRHTGALFYILNGGDPFSLQKILGHTHMNMVRRYVQMTNMDVQNQHSVHSPLNYVFKN